ncbi:TPA: NAD-dependent epimerase/dehydratase family protein [Burkholderia aenigmatica]|uniref:NAD-dependent epimerase/dehydratase family protein n=1 Tax=Burkholderia sp. AU45251 TaxID=3059204 RepID=UPI00265279CF|nr:NAD-dependent epimerase/dehydratase family protein [Burkholderia sp. AU45251]HDR9488011.1 NAD-dependent epimerase/dehydratase family protein [Burkholderia aenigmatica]MDN7521159.1 NAD-dependent epimerase/dehydratase family protein [Burkholderia sp. AU45251]HDR9519728.1 NAD-dependent epimerase/dehydratase family protein [Burkholderia aenigmatica]HDR9596758.1 NAD-dependent epimerase/dehydratase family protein [Burkholderia aenigmatica]HDR9604155.1 NAD-dependent epimerase/dehydratase family pr
MRRVLITGIGGFTGRHLANSLSRADFSVVGMSHRPLNADAWPTHVCDLLDREKLLDIVAATKPDFVVHLAAVASVAHPSPAAIYETNIVGTRNLLDALLASESRPRAVLLASSGNVYGNATVQPIAETQSLAPTNDYALSKLAMEYMAKSWQTKLPIVTVRPFNYTGIGQSIDFLLPKLISHFRSKLPVLKLGNLDVVRDFSDVRSVTEAYTRLLTQDNVAGQTFNVCSGVGHALKDVLTMLRELTGHHPDVVSTPELVRGNEVHTLIGDPSRLQRAVGPMNWIPLRETLVSMLEAGV